jgi:DNA-binding LacI/PurR family transcriptional regulator/DNA-binding transcriptional regulator YhcF (GntR family)
VDGERRRTRLTSVVERLDRLVRQFPAGKPLPGIRRLAPRLGASHVTTWRAVRALRDVGVLEVRVGGSVVAAGPNLIETPKPEAAPPTSLPPPRPWRWEEVRGQLAREILEQRHPPGARLPSAALIGRRLVAAPVNVSRALRSLESERLLTREGRGYRVAAPTKRRLFGRVVFLGRSRRGDLLSDLSARSLELWRRLESECRRFDVGLQVDTIEEDIDRLLGRATGSPVESRDVLGYVVRNLDLEARLVARLLAALAATGKPVSVIDEVGVSSELVPARRRGRLRVFSLANSVEAGRDVGRELLRLGHRKVAFLSSYDGAAWSRHRLLGLELAFAAVGLPKAVVPLLLGEFEDDFDLRDVIRRSASYQEISRRLQSFARAQNPLSEIDAATFHRHPGFRVLLGEIVAGRMLPLFERALSDRGITAWVGLDDTIAAAALRFLSASSVRVPEQISLVGFDNSSDALRGGLASYDFNVPSLSNAVVQHVLAAPGRRPRAVVEIPGRLAERASLGPAPRR